MRNYRAVGTIMLEGQGSEADYDFDMEWHEFREPNEMDVLHYMMETGLIQIISESIEEWEYA